MSGDRYLVLFTLDGQRFALPIEGVERVLPMVEVTPLPNAPELVLGVLNVQGRILSVVNLRRRFGLPDREPELTDRLILTQTSRRAVALPVDAVEVIECGPAAWVPAQSILPDAEGLDGVIKDGDGLILIYDLEALLSREREQGTGNREQEDWNGSSLPDGLFPDPCSRVPSAGGVT